ncbi:MAG: carbohydrate binding family 9 domain-containing protein [Armatimonadetes bacterium]|nr:carbohydrate binding family 9 domain-containing protein [Armatimonadota bacterium]
MRYTGSAYPALRKALILFTAMLWLAVAEVSAQEANPIIPAVKAEVPPEIDGNLDDPCWQELAPVSGFFHDLKPAVEETRVRLCYGADALYVAFECDDREPKSIRAQQTKRNGGMEQDDNVALGVSPLCDRQTYYWFTVNALGTQGEDIPGGSASKVEWRGDWRAASKIHDKGWSAEMAIPFALLKYPKGQQRFGITLGRNFARFKEWAYWPFRSSYYSHDTEAYWHGLEPPRFQPKPLLMPYTLWGSGKGLKSSAGLDVKYVAENNITSLLTYKPDFQTIEDVVQTIDFSYNPRYLEDRRPFFTEGGWVFSDERMFYSRMINEVDVGVKAYGKQKNLSFGAMEAHHSGMNAALFNMGYDVTPLGKINFALVDHRDKGLTNTAYKIGTDWRKPDKINAYYYGVNLRGSRTNGAASQPLVSAYIDRYGAAGILGWHLYYADVPGDYNATLAYLPEKGFRNIEGYLEYAKEFRQGPLLNWEANLGLGKAHHRSGGLFHENFSPSFRWGFRRQTHARIAYEYQNRPPYRDRITELLYQWNDQDLYRGGNVRFRFGRLAGGQYRFFSAQQGVKITSRFSLHFNYERLNLVFPDGTRDQFNQSFLSGLYEFSPERSIATRIIGRSGKTNVYFAYRQELRRGADIFVVWGDPNADSTVSRIGVKVVNTY